MATTTYGSPYAQSADLVSAWPATSLSVADRIDDVSFKGNGLNNQTASYTGVLLDAGKTVMMNVATANTFTIPASGSIAYELGTVLRISNKGAGTTTVQPNGGVTLNGGNISLTQYQSCEVQLVATDIWVATVKPPALSGLAFITSSTFSAVSSVSINSCFTSTYANYLILPSLDSTSNNNSLLVRLRASGTDNSSSNYLYGAWDVDQTGGSAANSSAGTTSFNLGTTPAGTPSVTSIVNVFDPQRTMNTRIHYHSFFNTGTNTGARMGSGYLNVTTAYDGFTLLTGAGTITGNVRVFGYQNS
jgi:hypothetical protein